MRGDFLRGDRPEPPERSETVPSRPGPHLPVAEAVCRPDRFESVFTIALQTLNFADAEKKALEILQVTDLFDVRDWRSERLPIERRKWLDMARILATDPKLIMLDEVMAGLNPSEVETSVAMVRRINERGITILFIEHVMKAVVKLCDRIVVLNEGKLLCTGRPDEVMNNPDVIKAYLGGGFKHA